MENAINSYETLFITDISAGEEAAKATIDKFTALISANAAEVIEISEWGKKRLAYEIQHMREGFYYFIQFEAETTAPAEIERHMRIMDNVLRYLVVKKEA